MFARLEYRHPRTPSWGCQAQRAGTAQTDLIPFRLIPASACKQGPSREFLGFLLEKTRQGATFPVRSGDEALKQLLALLDPWPQRWKPEAYPGSSLFPALGSSWKCFSRGFWALKRKTPASVLFFGLMLNPVATYLPWDLQRSAEQGCEHQRCQESLLPSTGTCNECPFTSWAPLLALCAQPSLPPAAAARNHRLQDGQESPSKNNQS